MILYIIVALLIGIVGLLIFLLIRISSRNSGKDFQNSINEVLPDLFKPLTDQLITTANEKLSAEKNEIKTDLNSKKEVIEDLVKRTLEEIKNSNEKNQALDKERITSFVNLKTALEDYKSVTNKLSDSTENLSKVLSNNQLRGQFGEQVAEDLLKLSGFAKGKSYVSNISQGANHTKPDFTIFLADGMKINVDAKFPYTNYKLWLEAKEKSHQGEYLSKFKQDIKTKIDQLSTREYINPDENTMDFVIMFIPNEMIFSIICEKTDLWEKAMSQKVLLAGPFSFIAILRMVSQSYDNFRYQQNINKMIVSIKKFDEEFKKYNLEFSKIGEKIDSLTKQYDIVNNTRTRQLNRSIDRVSIESDGMKLLEEDNKTS